MNKNIRARRWTFVLNNPTEEERDKISALKGLTYLIYGNEHFDKGTPHLQGYAVFKNPKAFETLKKEVPRAHWEKAIKGHEANIKYCSKEDEHPFEMGERPITKAFDKFKIGMEDLKRDPIKGYQSINGKRMYNGMNLELEMYSEIEKNELEKPNIWYIHGDSGTGKTYFAIKKAIELYGKENVAMIRFKNNFGISNNPQAKALILPEFRPSCLDAASFLELTDCYGMILNVKGGQVFIRPKAIFICSILNPFSIYKEEINEQFRRRITYEIDMNDDPYDPEQVSD